VLSIASIEHATAIRMNPLMVYSLFCERCPSGATRQGRLSAHTVSQSLVFTCVL